MRGLRESWLRVARFVTQVLVYPFGYRVLLAQRGTDIASIELKSLTHFNCGHRRFDRYDRALHIANEGQRDSFLKRCRYFLLQQALERVEARGIPGDCAECGCFRGHSTYIIADILRDSRSQRKLFVFDSFEGGLSERQPQDVPENQRRSERANLKERAHFASSEEHVANVLKEFDFVELMPGWIPDRFAEVSGRTFAVAHLDVDLYEPTRDSLQFFYERLSPGGLLVIDDYGWSNFPGAKKACDEFYDKHPDAWIIEHATGGALIVKPDA